MTQEEKQVLLKDLCARLPYGVVVNYNGLARPLFSVAPTQHFQITLDNALDGKHNGLAYVSLDVDGEEPKPYLRPMSSMTEEESNELESITFPLMEKDWDGNENPACIRWIDIPKYMDFMLSHHFDFMGLIPKDLAIEVTESNNSYEQNKS